MRAAPWHPGPCEAESYAEPGKPVNQSDGNTGVNFPQQNVQNHIIFDIESVSHIHFVPRVESCATGLQIYGSCRQLHAAVLRFATQTCGRSDLSISALFCCSCC